MIMHVSNGKIIWYNFVRQTHQENRDNDSQPIYGWPFAYAYCQNLTLSNLLMRHLTLLVASGFDP